ncbi:Oidioi.mRNA.OKI2018_I69.chr1.g136.t1.cds [Oikopleura dioica]|uniref:Oidioi.mRNA.OKI2018_I69.chr1.g136.t1.cds n=1 Tax=Oikopleura dioica TaxID=34765 RepID=A0ABN7SN52_OIKDI|nr:Oidioi.mRNA.OKI2018_I69.chr1.g136.t1.cds [Oikopleura dioica]
MPELFFAARVLDWSSIFGPPKSQSCANIIAPTTTSFATTFSNRGSIDGSYANFDDYDADAKEYSVSSSGNAISLYYGISGYGTGGYAPNTEKSNRFTSTSDGITFDFAFFQVDTGGDFLVFRTQDGQKYFFTGDLTGTRFSFSSSYVDVHFTTDGNDQEVGFDVQIINGYQANNDISNLQV